MHATDVFVVWAWLVVTSISVVALQQAWRAHTSLDYGRPDEAQGHILRSIGACLLLSSGCAFMFGVRFLIKPLVIPAVIGCAAFIIVVVLLLQARVRFHSECPPSHP